MLFSTIVAIVVAIVCPQMMWAQTSKPLTLTAVEAGATVKLNMNDAISQDVHLIYSTDGGTTWSEYVAGTTITLEGVGDAMMLKAGTASNTKTGTNEKVSDSDNHSKFKMSGNVAASGNVMSLLDATMTRTDVPKYAFVDLFFECTSLTEAPELPATTLADHCYCDMFKNCENLTEAPELPATTLAEKCYFEMFSVCKSLTEAPELPATTLAKECYFDMFRECTSLTKAPELHATTLAEECCHSMFRECTSLIEAPELPATTLTNACYAEMFNCCTSLKYLKVAFTDWDSDEGACSSWLEDVSSDGLFVCPAELDMSSRDVSHVPEGWVVMDDKQKPLTLTAVEAGATVKLNMDDDISQDVHLIYSTDGGTTWSEYVAGTQITLASVGDAVMLKAGTASNTKTGSNEKFSDSNDPSQFKMTGKVAASGSVMSLLDAAMTRTDVPEDAFAKLFEGCASLTSAPELPATTLAKLCYNNMFYGCASLTSAPELPATTLADYCYMNMFSGCTSLTEAPELPATTLAYSCYLYMFNKCTSLTEAPELPATTLAHSCYSNMFSGCTSLTSAPELPATTLAEYCYGYMFEDCTSLTEAPALPATTLVEGCYESMFYGCTSLTEAPALPATTLAEECYSYMFYGCTSLNYISVNFTAWNDNDLCTDSWVWNVASTGTFVCPAALDTDTRDESYVPEGWTVENKQPSYTEHTLTFTAKEASYYYATFSSDKDVFVPLLTGVNLPCTVSVEDGEMNVNLCTSNDLEWADVNIDEKDYYGYYIPANTGMLFMSTTGDPYTYYTVDDASLTNKVLEVDNMLRAASVEMTGDYKFYKLAYDDYSQKTGLGFYYGAQDGGAFTCKEGLAYLAVPTTKAQETRAFTFSDMTTAINGLQTEDATRDAAIYNINGQRLQKMQRGLNIVGGKKYFMK